MILSCKGTCAPVAPFSKVKGAVQCRNEKFRGGKVTFGNDYDVIDVQSTMMRLFCYDQLINIGGGTFFIVWGPWACAGWETKWAFAPSANWQTN